MYLCVQNPGQDDISGSQINKVFTKASKLIYQISQKYVVNEDKLVQLEESINRFCLNDITFELKAHGAKKLGN